MLDSDMDTPSAAAAVEPTSNGTRTCSTHASLQSPFYSQESDRWTDSLSQTQHVDCFRASDFATTSLGATGTWGPALRLYTSMLFADSRGAVIFWGPDFVSFYNEPYAPCYGEMHPFQMGKPFRLGFPNVWDTISAIFNQVITTGKSMDVHNIQFFLERNGYTEETYFVGQFIPLRGDSGDVEGIYNTVFESTENFIRDRMRVVVDQIAAIPPFSTEKTFQSIKECLRNDALDIPMAMIFAFDSFADGGNNLRLQSSIGIPKEHDCAPMHSRLETCDVGIIPHLRNARNCMDPSILKEGELDIKALFHDIEWRGFGENSTEIIIIPLSNAGTLLGFYVQGVNPRSQVNNVSQQSIVDIARQVEAKWIASRLIEEGRQRELDLERKASDSENRLRQMAQQAPFGMYQLTPSFEIRWANDRFWNITRLDPKTSNVRDLFDIVAPESRGHAEGDFNALMNGAPSLDRELRLNHPWSSSAADETETEGSSVWILASSFPGVVNGQIELIMGYIADISQQKWAESVQGRNAEAAIQAKRRQEDFIDTTSHEMRNPLNAIMQLADGIRSSLSITGSTSLEEHRSIGMENLDAASTILTCAAHQKRVIDDILTLSRLESHMLSIDPVPSRIETVVEDVRKMLQADASAAEINIRVERAPSAELDDIDMVFIDSSRIRQILINFIVNSIKFTASQTIRDISIEYGVQTSGSPEIRTPFGDMIWIEPATKPLSNLPTHQASNRIYLHFCIKDTGIGMTQQETEKLFRRFSQASKHTHMEYGGTGLGLHICRQLVEMQGGRVGVVSQKDAGSAFGFFIETVQVPSPNSTGEDNLRQTGTTKRKTDHNEILKTVPPDELSIASSLPTRNAWDPRKLNVLLVEDNCINQRILQKQLNSAVSSVVVANHGKHALEVIKTSDCWNDGSNTSLEQRTSVGINVVLMDWEMPVMNGLECTKHIRQLESEGKITKRLLIVGTTANVRGAQVEKAIAAGMDLVVGKPFTVSELLEKISQSAPVV